MKTFLLAFLFAAFVAHIRADALDDYLMADENDGEPDRHPYIQCKIDLYDCIKAGTGKLACLKTYKSCLSVLIPTIPPFVIQCKDQLVSCIGRTSFGFFGRLQRVKCYLALATCLRNGGPPAGVVYDDLDDGEPTRHPYLQCKIDLYKCFKAGEKGKLECLKDYKSCMAILIPTIPPFAQCKIDLYKCFKAGEKGKLECLKDYKSCMAILIPTIPPFVIGCKNDLKTCLSSSSGILAKARCFKTFAICLKNKGSSVFDEDDRHPLVQCKIDLYDCFKAGKNKLQCLRDYKSCLAVLLPTLPPFITLCNDARKACLASSDGWKGRAQCYYGFAKCLVNRGPSSGLVFDAEDGEPTRHPYVQCNIDVYDCIKSGKDKKECFKEYTSCTAVLFPTIPPFIRTCYADFKTCYGGASRWAWQDKLRCGLDFKRCLTNKGVSL